MPDNYDHTTIPEKPGIYRITCVASNTVYIGQAVDLRERRRTHFKDLRKGRHHNSHFQNAFNKYGETAFVFEVMEILEADPDALAEAEERHIQASRNAGIKLYNQRPASNSNLGIKLSSETCLRISEAKKGVKQSDETCRKKSETFKGDKNPFYGKTHSCETRYKISEAAKKRQHKPHSDETRRKISVANKGKPHRKMTVEERRKMSKSHKGRVVSDETRRKLSEALKGRIVSEETRRKISESKKSISDETRRKLSESKKGHVPWNKGKGVK